MDTPNIITIIAPVKFKKEIMEVYDKLTDEGNIVLLPNFTHKGDEDVMMALHKQKIDIANSVYVVNVDGYMGRGTYEEIGYSTTKGIPVEYLCKPKGVS